MAFLLPLLPMAGRAALIERVHFMSYGARDPAKEIPMSRAAVDRAFAEKFLTSVDSPLDYGVYFLFHDWWAEAPQDHVRKP